MSNFRFGLISVFVGFAVFAILLTLLMPAIHAAREAARSNQCTQNMHEIGLALQSYVDKFGRFPALSTEPYPQMPGVTTSPVTGFSWLTLILPYLDEDRLANGIARKSKNFAAGAPAFSGAIVDADGRHYATYQPRVFICPTSTGKSYSDLSGKLPYANVPGQTLSGWSPIGIGTSNYVALSATDIDRMRDNGAAANGVIVPGRGLSRTEITDGTSKTLIACETRERSLNSWLDGSVNWGVGADPNNARPPAVDANGYLTILSPDGASLNVGPGSPRAATRYLTRANSPNGYEWAWGPSSEHAGGVVKQLYADAAVRGQTDDISPGTYIQLITANGNDRKSVGDRALPDAWHIDTIGMEIDRPH